MDWACGPGVRSYHMVGWEVKGLSLRCEDHIFYLYIYIYMGTPVNPPPTKIDTRFFCLSILSLYVAERRTQTNADCKTHEIIGFLGFLGSFYMKNTQNNWVFWVFWVLVSGTCSTSDIQYATEHKLKRRLENKDASETHKIICFFGFLGSINVKNTQNNWVFWVFWVLTPRTCSTSDIQYA